MKPYLICLEIQPVETEEHYDVLPLHCTLVHWFWLPDRHTVFDDIERLIAAQKAPQLIVQNEDEFTAMTTDGSIPVRVSRVRKTARITTLHEAMTTLLEAHGVRYEAAQYVHDGYAPHMTHHHSKTIAAGERYTPTALYIVSADAPEYGNKRTIIKKLRFMN